MIRAALMLVCVASCTPTETPGGPESRSGGSESGGSESGESQDSGEAQVEIGRPERLRVETAAALGDPPSSDLATDAAASTEPANESTREASPAPVTEIPGPVTTPESASRPTTILAPARSGRLRLSDVHEVIREHRPDVTTCYEQGLALDHTLAGEAKVRFLIGPRGRIESAEVYESTLSNPGVEACILAAMQEWRFPRPRPRGTSVLLTYPYVLSTD